MSYEVTRLYYDNRLINTIDYGSKFSSMKRAKVRTPEEREAVCQEIINGWVHNAGWDPKLFRIEHGKSEPVELSQMAQGMLR